MFINFTVHSRDDKVASYSRNDILAGIKGSPASDKMTRLKPASQINAILEFSLSNIQRNIVIQNKHPKATFKLVYKIHVSFT